MRTLKLRFFLIASCCYLILVDPAFSQMRLKITDQHNMPLANAVIEFNTPISLKKATQNQIYIMDQVDKKFSPQVLIIPQNSFVSFPNSDDIRHHVYSFSTAKTFELKLYAGKPKKPIHFNKSGIVIMGCNIHDSMVGYIYVSATGNSLISNEKGEIFLDSDLPLPTQLQVWHPRSTAGLSQHTRFTIEPSMLDKNEISLVITTTKPEPRDSFEELNQYEH